MTLKDYIESLPKARTSIRAEKIKEIAQACSVDLPTVYNWINGVHGVRPIYRKTIAAIVNISEAELFPEDAKENN